MNSTSVKNGKLLFCCASPYRGGAEEYGLTVARAAKQAGYSIDASFPPTDEMQTLVRDFQELGAEFYPLNIVEPDTAWAEQGDTKGFETVYQDTLTMLDKVKPDIVHLELGWPNRSLGIIQACAQLNIPTVVVFQLVRDNHVYTKETLEKYTWARTRNQQWVSVSENNRELLCKSFRCSKSDIQLIYNGARMVAFNKSRRDENRRKIRNEFGFDHDTPILLTVGQLHMQKGYFEYAPIIPELLDNIPNLRFLWVGEGLYRGKLEEQLADLGVSDRVILTGRRNDVPKLLSAADLFVFPTLFEGFPFSVIEAAAQKLPIVTTDASSLPEFIDNGKNGLMVKAKDRKGLRDAVLQALASPVEMQEMAEKAYLQMAPFSEERMLEQTLELFDAMCSKSKT